MLLVDDYHGEERCVESRSDSNAEREEKRKQIQVPSLTDESFWAQTLHFLSPSLLTTSHLSF